jgi:hypothetical protein
VKLNSEGEATQVDKGFQHAMGAYSMCHTCYNETGELDLHDVSQIHQIAPRLMTRLRNLLGTT